MIPNIRPDWLAAQLTDTMWTNIRCVAEIDSTNAELLRLAQPNDIASHPESGREAADTLTSGSVLVADYQSAGRGRLERSWVAPPGAMVALSVYVSYAADTPPSRQFIPLLGGLAVQEGLATALDLTTQLKWPNDVLVSGRKVCGVLAQSTAHGFVLGMGINTHMTADQLPVPTATSLALLGVCPDPEPVVAAILVALEKWYRRWKNGADIATAYSQVCDSVGRDVRVVLSPSETVTGRALRIESDGSLIVATDVGERSFSAGDVFHLRS